MGNSLPRTKIFMKRPTNTEGVEAGRNVDRQAQATEEMYKLVKPPNDAAGQKRGTLVEATAKAFNEKNFEGLDNLIKEELEDYLYNDGEGFEFPISRLVEMRNAERGKQIVAKKQKERQISLRSSIRQSITHEEEEVSKDFKSSSKDTRFCCWRVDKRGAVGETILHLCFLNNTRVHYILAEHLIRIYPNSLHDIYHSEEYYGESVLHMAIANENIPILKQMLEYGKKVGLNLQERCYGNFFCPDDQKATRCDDINSEVVVVDYDTDYKGHTYWGELPLSFAACLGQPEAVKLLVEYGVDIFAFDSNGNNVLHMLVIHNKKDMFNLAYRLSKENPQPGKNLLESRNRQGFTPLTLAAKLANKDLFDHILELKSSTLWAYGPVTCKEYNLCDLDTIDSKDGSINSMSALNIVLAQDSRHHLDMLDGLLYQLLHDKWKSYAKIRFYRRAGGFFIYMVLLITAVYLQPGNTVPITSPGLNIYNQNCSIQTFATATDYARTVIEIIVYFLAGVFIYFAISEIRFQGLRLFGWTLYNAPTKAGFLFSCVLVIIVLPCRLTCSVAAEDILISLVICTCIPYCLFFCRGFKLVGPFIVMIYKMIVGDLLIFLIIYSIFLLGFSQAMFVIFRGTPHEFFSDWFESIMVMFLMTLGEFQDTYETFDTARNPSAPKVLFLFYMVLVYILLLNMLIAMMGNTFNRIAETQKEWQRQWAKIVLVMEQSVSPSKRKSKQRRYSQPTGEDGKERALVIRTRTKATGEEDENTMRQYINKFQKNKKVVESESSTPSPSPANEQSSNMI
uniref:transient receptor potential cation channel subfamily V member 5-like n=1 Tax=Styela clava TaxID=7725 RepID=UPI001939559A|nr:transient receptor potential cation channel subfamily V member 5-like [Styela clava]